MTTSGRPRLYTNSDDLDAACNRYFDACDIGETVQVVRRGKAVDVHKDIPYTVPDLAVALGYSHRSSIWDLKQNPIFSDTIRRALSRIEGQRVRKALLGEQEPRFAQFDLVNNCGYVSSKEQLQIKQQVITYSDKELDARLAALEVKTKRIDDGGDGGGQPAIECDEQPGLLE